MASKKEILQVIYSSIDELNKTLPEDERLKKTSDQIIVGEDSTVDSLGFVNFVVDLEEKINNAFGKEVYLTDEELMTSEDTPFRKVEILADYLTAQINE